MKLFARATLALGVAACGSIAPGLAACGSSDQRVSDGIADHSAPTPIAATPSPDPTPVGAPLKPEPKPAPGVVAAPTAAPDPAAIALAKPYNDFGFDLWRELAADAGGNLALSPASLSLAFSMTYAGARGSTADDMKKVLHLGAVADPHTAAGLAIARWNGEGKPYALRIANRLFGEATAPFETPFLDRMKAAYGAPLEPVDFEHSFDAARRHINDWVADRTEDKIRDLLPDGSLDELTRLVLVNAIYFKGQWAARFDAAQTKDGAFHAAAGDVKVPFMHRSGSMLTGGGELAQVVELPYVGGDLAMDLVLPKGDLKSLAGLDADGLAALVGTLYENEEVELALPRFRIETPAMPLKQPLLKLGMGKAFDHDADFSGMSSLRPLFIDDAFHKVFVEVNEEGTEAAAATAVVMATESARIPLELRFDRPFMFFIRDVKTGHVLFMGRVVNPA
ncbi:MAG: serpin family protein [Myxococcota bacterium]